MPTYVDDNLPEQRILEQAVRLPDGGAVTGWAAARLHGAAFFDGLDRDGTTHFPVPLALGRRGRIRPDEHVVLVYHALPPGEVVVRHGIRVVTPERAVVDHQRLIGDPREVVVALDMLAAAAVVSPEQVALHGRALAAGERVALELAVSRASEHSRSPNETRLRLIAEVDAGLPRLLVNCPVHCLSGRLLGIADLLDVEAGLAIEYDGAEHRTATRHTRDVAKDEAFRRAGLELTRITGYDLRDVSLVVDRLTQARSRAAFTAAEQRRWVASPPANTLHERLVEQRLALHRHEELVADTTWPL